MKKLLATILLLSSFASTVFALSSNTHSTDLERGSSQNHSIADASQTGLDFTDAVSVCAWLNVEATGPASGDQYGIVGKFLTGGDQRSYAFWYANESGTLKLVWQQSSNGTDPGLSFNSRDVTLNTGTFYHVCTTKSGTTLRFYVDSVKQGTDAVIGSSIFAGSATFTVGSTRTTDHFFDGLIDDVRIWSRQLTDAEVEALYTDPCDDDNNGANLEGWWLFDNDSTDQTANNNDLTANNSAGFTTTHAYDCAAAGGEEVTNSQPFLIGF